MLQPLPTYKLLFTASAIRERVLQIGSEISLWISSWPATDPGRGQGYASYNSQLPEADDNLARCDTERLAPLANATSAAEEKPPSLRDTTRHELTTQYHNPPTPDPGQQDLIVIPIMRGALYFAADLTRAIHYSVELHPLRFSSYAANLQQKSTTEIQSEEATLPLAGRRVLLVDDICDSGRTLDILQRKFLSGGAREVRSAVLVNRSIPGREITPHYSGFDYNGAEWLVGYGLEDEERFRNLSDVYAITHSSS